MNERERKQQRVSDKGEVLSCTDVIFVFHTGYYYEVNVTGEWFCFPAEDFSTS